jgi:hypothetical protein
LWEAAAAVAAVVIATGNGERGTAGFGIASVVMETTCIMELTQAVVAVAVGGWMVMRTEGVTRDTAITISRSVMVQPIWNIPTVR